MKHIRIDAVPGFDEWRIAARDALQNKIPPDRISWGADTGHDDLFARDHAPPRALPAAMTVPRSFLSMAETACCHSDTGKFALLYRMLWRLSFEDRKLLHRLTDKDVLQLSAMVKAVRRDAYKITAFLRFREIRCEDKEYFVAWYEPEHYTLERVLPFFQTRFRNMRWSILTPYRAAHWDGEEMILEEKPDPDLYPKEDDVEKYWLGYYSSIFNPARPKKSAMMTQMPKKYWKNMPETVLVKDLLRTSQSRAADMIDRSKS